MRKNVGKTNVTRRTVSTRRVEPSAKQAPIVSEPEKVLAIKKLKELDKGSGASIQLVEVKFKDGRVEHFVEKLFPTELAGFFGRTADRLASLGLSVCPARVVVDRQGRQRLLFKDLSEGGALSVVDFSEVGFQTNPKVARLKNFSEISNQVEREETLASRQGIRIPARAWVVAIDLKTNTGKPFIFDLKQLK